jgi:hypothetical protein
MDDIIVRYVKLPDSVNGFIMEDPAGDGNIYINKDKPPEIPRRTLAHEVRHFRYGHLKDLSKAVKVCEQEAEKVKDPAVGAAEPFELVSVETHLTSDNCITAAFDQQEVKYV